MIIFHQQGTRFTGFSPPGQPSLKYRSLKGQLKFSWLETSVDELLDEARPFHAAGFFTVAYFMCEQVQFLTSFLDEPVYSRTIFVFPAGAGGRFSVS
jgi:hypothetical protein